MKSWVVWWLIIMSRGVISNLAVRDGFAEVDEEDAEAARLVRELVVGRGAGEQEHEVRVLGAGDEDLLAVDDVAVAVLAGEGLDARGLGAGVGLGDAEGLQAQLAGGDAWQVALLLLVVAVPEERAHDVHLGVGGGRRCRRSG